MMDCDKLVKALRLCQFGNCLCSECPYYGDKGNWDGEDLSDCDDKMHLDAAAAIEELQAKAHEKDCFIGMLKVQMGNMEQQLPKHGEWIELEDRNERKYSHICSVCHHFNIAEGEVEFYRYCPNCGAKMEVQDESK